MEIICCILQILALLQCIVCRRAVFRDLGIQYISSAKIQLNPFVAMKSNKEFLEEHWRFATFHKQCVYHPIGI